MNKLLVYFAMVAFILLQTVSCKTDDTKQNEGDFALILDPEYQELETIGAVARCTGPTGPYITQVYSSLDGETHFRQVYSNRSYVFEAILESTTTGFMLDFESGSQEPLPEVVVLVVRGHEFHKILCFPETFFNGIALADHDKQVDNNVVIFNAIDQTGKKAVLTYDPEQQLITKLEFTNPVDTSEMIEVIPVDWIDTDFGRQVIALEVVQARKDTFSFKYDSLSLNDQWIDLARGDIRM